ncbi:nicolin-1 [Mytilus galloprovincialis]|uniref:Nicolin-1 n=1 Tax=Mytilus galloprovincialis TaxID=29158 RepID=A0A8B6HR77_MYTGA|nr:nicolin-1 [Mytilus galloprovincialis]
MNELSNITQLRVILQQPSPVWKDFRIEELKLYRSAEMNKTPALPSWLIEDSGKSKKSDHDLDNDSFCDKLRSERSPCLASVPNLEAISSSLQHLWALAEEVGAKQTERALGRYEVSLIDGFRRVDMLNYKIQIASERRFTLHAYFSAFYLHLPSSNGKRAIDAEI